MLGRSHVLLGGAGFLLIGQSALRLAGAEMGPGEVAAGTIVCAGAAMLPDLDHPQATIARTLGPLTQVPSKGIAALFGGHRQGTHSVLFAAIVGLLCAVALAGSSGPWVALIISILCASFFVRALTDASPGVTGGLSAALGASLVVIAPSTDWLWVAVALGCLLHDLGDALTVEGVPPAWPLSKARLRIPLVGHTGGRMEHVVAGLCGLAMCYLAWTSVLGPTWQGQQEAKAIEAPARSAPAPSKRAADHPVRRAVDTASQRVRPHAPKLTEAQRRLRDGLR